MESARPARDDDVPRLQELLTAAIAATAAARGASLYRRPQRGGEPGGRLRSAIADDDTLVLAGCVDDYVAGLAMVTLEGGAGDNRVGVIEELFVEEAARDVGVGEALLTAAVAWCAEHSCAGVDIAALPGDRQLKNLCERAGFRARVLVLHRRL